MNRIIKTTLLTCCQYAIILLCLFFLIKTARLIHPEQLSLHALLSASVISIAYFFCYILMAVNWQQLLILLDHQPYRLALLYHIYCKTTLAKYLPSNIGHFAGRQWLGKQLGLSHQTILISSLLEVALLLFSTLLLVLVGLGSHLLIIPTTLSHLLAAHHRALTIFFIIGSLCMGLLFSWRFKSLLPWLNRSTIWPLTRITLQYLLFFLLTGSLFYLVYVYAGYTTFNFKNAAQIIIIYAAAWLIGYITPGSPGGLGVRETVMILLLQPLMTHQQALIGAVIYRLASIGGDVLSYVCASCQRITCTRASLLHYGEICKTDH